MTCPFEMSYNYRSIGYLTQVLLSTLFKACPTPSWQLVTRPLPVQGRDLRSIYRIEVLLPNSGAHTQGNNCTPNTLSQCTMIPINMLPCISGFWDNVCILRGNSCRLFHSKCSKVAQWWLTPWQTFRLTSAKQVFLYYSFHFISSAGTLSVPSLK